MRFERRLIRNGDIVAGIDEVGRGALAGPMMVGAVTVRECTRPPAGLDDSKRLTAECREALVEPLRAWAAEWSLGVVSAAEIDTWGLRRALAVASTRALEALSVMPTHVLIDGPLNLLTVGPDNEVGDDQACPELRFASMPITTIVGGDQRSAVIAAAAVLAKVARDALMVELDNEYREYCWRDNKGYGVPEHLDALRRHGTSAHHRTSWNLPERSLF
jgi:ribonuclease HII